MNSVDSDCGFSFIQKPVPSMSTFGKTSQSSECNWDAVLDTQRIKSRMNNVTSTDPVDFNSERETKEMIGTSRNQSGSIAEDVKLQSIQEFNSQLTLANTRLWEVNRNLLRDLAEEREQNASLEKELRALKNQMARMNLENSFTGSAYPTASSDIAIRIPAGEFEKPVRFPSMAPAENNERVSQNQKNILRFAFSELKKCHAQMSEMNLLLSKQQAMNGFCSCGGGGSSHERKTLPGDVTDSTDFRIKSDSRNIPENSSDSSSEPFPSPPAPLNPEVLVLEEPWEEYQKSINKTKSTVPTEIQSKFETDGYDMDYTAKTQFENSQHEIDEGFSKFSIGSSEFSSNAGTSFTRIPYSNLNSCTYPESHTSECESKPAKEVRSSKTDEDLVITVKLVETKPSQTPEELETKDKVMFIETDSASNPVSNTFNTDQQEIATGKSSKMATPSVPIRVEEKSSKRGKSSKISTEPSHRLRTVSETDFDCNPPPSDYDVIAHERQCPICGRDFRIFDSHSQAKFEAHADQCADESLGEEPRTMISRYEYDTSLRYPTDSFPVEHVSPISQPTFSDSAETECSRCWTCPICAAAFHLHEMEQAQFETHVRSHFRGQYPPH